MSIDVTSTAAERRTAGRALRDKIPRRQHAIWNPPPDRPDPVELLIESGKGRIESLLPIRYGRMMKSPFAFLRGAAAVMAFDLSRTPNTKIRVQAGGDCHIMNFGGFATPERNIIFDINDFDEALPAPWEWDLKRLAASVEVAGRAASFKARERERAVTGAVRSYRRRIAQYADRPLLDVWYDRIEFKKMAATLPDLEAREIARKAVRKARQKSIPAHIFPTLAVSKGASARILDKPPLLFHEKSRDLAAYRADAEQVFKRYSSSLPANYRVLFDRFEFEDMALKVVGVGSVGTYCAVALFMAAGDEPLFLQIKQANASVLEPYAGASRFATHGERVVVGQRLMQAASDIFLGWTVGMEGRHFYVRQLRDIKTSLPVDTMQAADLAYYAEVCAWALARAHARAGDAAKIAGYLGSSDLFDNAIAGFAAAYGDQTERDHAALVKAIKSGRLKAASG